MRRAGRPPPRLRQCPSLLLFRAVYLDHDLERRGEGVCRLRGTTLAQVENPQRSPTQKNISYFYKAAVLITSRAAAAKHSVRSAHTPFAAASPPCGGGRVVAACTGS